MTNRYFGPKMAPPRGPGKPVLPVPAQAGIRDFTLYNCEFQLPNQHNQQLLWDPENASFRGRVNRLKIVILKLDFDPLFGAK